MINGVDVENLRSAMNQVAKDSTAGHYTFRAVTTWNGGARSTSRIRGFSVEGDEPPGLLGTDQAPNAVELVLGALGSCLSVGISYLATLSGIQIRSLRFEIEGDLDIRGFFGIEGIHPGYERIRVQAYLESDAKRQDLEKLLDKVIQTSPVTDIVARGIPVSIYLAG